MTPFLDLSKECILDDLESIRGRFEIPSEVISRLPHTSEKACSFAHGRAIERPELEERYQRRIEVALGFALTLSFEDFKSLVGARRLYECCLGPEPSELAPISPTLSSEVVAALPSSTVTPHVIRSKGKGKVLGETLQLITNYLSVEEKVVVTQSKAESAEVESSRLRKDLVEAMDQAMKSKEKADELKKALKVKKKLVAQKDDELQVALLRTAEARDGAITQFQESEHYFDLLFHYYFKGFELLRRWMLKYQGEAIDFSSLDFETVDIEMIADEAKEEENRATEGVASILVDIEAEVEAETDTTNVTAGGGGEAIDEDVDG
nr:hypothetical protein CFP56_38319 [Quercus suber]